MGGDKIKYFAYGGIAVFALTIIYFIISIYTTMVNGESRSQYEFSTFIQQANINSFNSIQSEDDASEFYSRVQNAVDTNSYIIAVVLHVMDSPVFAYPASSNVIKINEKNEPTLVGSSPMLKTYSMSLPNQNGQHVVLHAMSYTLRPQDIYNSAKISFLIILAYTLFLLVVIVYISLTNGTKIQRESTTLKIVPSEEDNETIPVVFREQESSWDDFFPEGESDAEAPHEESISDTNETSLDDGGSTIDDKEVFVKSFVEEYIDDEIDSGHDDYVEETSSISVEDAIANTNPVEYEVASDEEDQDSTIPQSNDPMGLFSDVTGLGWESYLETRLDSELIRSASSEQDLALIFIQIKDLENNIKVKKKVATLLLEYFKYRDFVFEYKNDGFAGIILDISLDQTMILTEQLYGQLESLLLGDGIASKIGIGVSTRSLRILPGSRIITEASEAVSRAFEEDGLPIVAFRVSPEKYRQFVSNSTD